MREKIKPGSTFLFGIIRILIFVFALTAVALIAVAIWFWTQLGTFSWTEIVFIGFGVFQLALVLLGCTAQTSTSKLRCFLFVITILFLIQLTMSIVIFAVGDKIIDQIVDKADAEEQWNKLKGYLFYVDAVVVVTLAVQLFLMVCVKCYIGSLRERNQDYDYKFVDDEGNKLTAQQKNQHDKDAIKQKYARKREEMREKYGKANDSGN